jgi:AraC-like DNA-binding protein
VAGSRLWLDGCVRAEIVHDGDLVQVAHWKCLEDRDPMRAERTHTHWVVTLLHTGACAVHQGRWDATVDPTTAIVHQPGTTYRTTHPFGCCDCGWSIALDRDAAEDALGRVGIDPRRWSRPSTTAHAAPIREVLEHLIALHRLRLHRAIDDVSVEELGLELLTLLLAPDERDDEPPHPGHARIAERACSWINEHFRDPVRLADVARAVRCSPFHLCRIFKRQRSVSIGGYVRRLRLAHILDSLGDDQRSITDIALDAGFGSHSHLTTTVSADLGAPPRDLRRRLLSDVPIPPMA